MDLLLRGHHTLVLSLCTSAALRDYTDVVGEVVHFQKVLLLCAGEARAGST